MDMRYHGHAVSDIARHQTHGVEGEDGFVRGGGTMGECPSGSAVVSAAIQFALVQIVKDG
jgi:hypothetical protein